MRTNECQVYCLQRISEGYARDEPQSLGRRLNRAITRHMSPRTKYKLKKHLNGVMLFFSQLIGRRKSSLAPSIVPVTTHLRAGDLVRVRSKEEVQASLNYWNELKGCGFLDGMWQYCGTTQRVLKPLERFLDERDYRVKTCKGIVLLEGLMCQGTVEFGRCDRSCLFFWREEWLEKIDKPSAFVEQTPG